MTKEIHPAPLDDDDDPSPSTSPEHFYVRNNVVPSKLQGEGYVVDTNLLALSPAIFFLHTGHRLFL